MSTSAGLSSTSKISSGFPAGFPAMSTSIVPSGGDREIEGRSPALFRLQPDSAVVALHDFLADCKPNARAGIAIRAVKALEYIENDLEVARIDADAVVLDSEFPVVIRHPGADMHAQRPLAAELDRVGDEILEHQPDQGFIGPYGRQDIVRDDGAGLVQRTAQSLHHPRQQ